MTKESKDAPLPGNHGQFGVNNASEEHKRLEQEPAPKVPEVADEPVKPKTRTRAS